MQEQRAGNPEKMPQMAIADFILIETLEVGSLIDWVN